MHRLSKDHYFFAFSGDNQPAITITPGENILIETMDCFSNQIQSEKDELEAVDWGKINPATGPVYVQGAQKGDALKVTVEEIHINNQAVMLTGKDLGVLGNKLEGMHKKVLPIIDQKVLFDDGIQLPVEPMIGVIGVAPEGEAVNCGTPDAHGGNMDTKIIKKGATVYLPVWVEGALLGMGDLHAVMGDGEVCVTGAEVSGEVQVKVELIKDLPLPTPLVLDDKRLAVIYSRETLDDAVDGAVVIMEELIRERTGQSVADNAMLLSLAGQVCVSQVVDPLKTARCEIPRWILDVYGFSL